MDDSVKQILNDSIGVISRLQVLSAYFENETIYKIYIKSQVIHQLFEGSKDLDLSRLTLFHVQFTSTVIELLRKIKRSNETKAELIFGEIRANQEVIERLDNFANLEADFRKDQTTQEGKVSLSLRRLYDALSADSDEYAMSKKINAFSERYAQDCFAEIPAELFADFIRYNSSEVYINRYAIIQRRLIGQLHRQNFACKFYTGFRAGNQSIEIYTFQDPAGEERFFLFLAGGNNFLFADSEMIRSARAEQETSSRVRLLRELTDRNFLLESKLALTRKAIPKQMDDLLVEYYQKISDIDFAEKSDFEVQANILKTMLNTDII